MKNSIKFTAAAVILVAATLSLTLLNTTVSSAYALEQTVQAFKNVRFLHLVSYNKADEIEDERWIEIGSHGRQVKYRQDNPQLQRLIIENEGTTAEYHDDKSTVVLYSNKDKQYQWVGDLGAWLENLRENGKIIEQNIIYNGKNCHKVLWPMMNAECFIDAQTKLPIVLGSTQLSYEIPSDDMFEIIIPDNYTVVDRRPGKSSGNTPDWIAKEELASTYFDTARYSMVQGEYQKAAQLLEYVVEKEPGRNWAWFWLGKSYYELGEYELAIDKYSKVLEMMGDVPYCFYARGLAYQQLQLNNEAQNDFSKALPWMIGSLRDTSTAVMFEYADDPTFRDGKAKPTQEQIIARMIQRLRIITGQDFGYNGQLGLKENKQALESWQDWWTQISSQSTQ
jgi:tetratricopeptide (TPR) repeat protein